MVFNMSVTRLARTFSALEVSPSGKPKKKQSKRNDRLLVLPVSLIAKKLRTDKRYHWGKPVTKEASIRMTACIEYLMSELVELAGNVARDVKRTRIEPRHIQIAVRNDEELNKLLGGITINA
jgi:histone H2A